MGFDKRSKELKILRNGSETIEIRSKVSEETEECETVTVREFFKDILSGPKLNKLKIDQLTILDLAHCDLMDLAIASNIPNLRHLGLSYNNLKKVPACLYSNWKYLEYLDLSHNMIDHFDMEPKCLRHIRKLKLNNNQLKWLPEWLMTFRCTNLEELNFSSNRAIHYKYFKNSYNLNIIQLRKLKLRNCHLLNTDYGFLKCFRKLEYLDISNKHKNTPNILHDVDDLFVRPQWKQLKVLRLNRLGLSVFPEGVAWLETLTELRINNNSISWLSDGMQFMVNLEILDVSHNALVALPPFLASLKGLRMVLAQDNYIDSAPDFASMPSLRVLDLYNNILRDISLNGEAIEAVDLECNHLNTAECTPCESYEAKKDNLRKTFENTGTRFDGPIPRRESFSSSVERYSCSYSDEDETELAHYVSKSISNCETEETEDWDSPAKPLVKNPDIDSEDEEWEGYEGSRLREPEAEKERVYVADEDWMFEDVFDGMCEFVI